MVDSGTCIHVFGLVCTLASYHSIEIFVTYSSLLVAIAIVCSSYINVLYPDGNLTMLDFLLSVEIAFFLFFFLMCAFVLLFSC